MNFDQCFNLAQEPSGDRALLGALQPLSFPVVLFNRFGHSIIANNGGRQNFFRVQFGGGVFVYRANFCALCSSGEECG